MRLYSPKLPDRLWGSPRLFGHGGSFLGVKLPARKADHSVLSSREVRNKWNYTSNVPWAFISRTGTQRYVWFVGFVAS